jgi:hypothetical protein
MLSAHPLHILNHVQEKPGTMSLSNINRSAVFGHLLVFSQCSEVDMSQKILNSDGTSENKSEIFLLETKRYIPCGYLHLEMQPILAQLTLLSAKTPAP